MNAIEITDLRKSYGVVEVLHGIDFSVKSRRLVGFLGSNGAGKTTTIRILLGLIEATAGTVSLFGKPGSVARKELRRSIGYLPGEVHFYTNLTGRATLDFFAHARKVDCRNEIKRLADVFDLDLRKSVRKYSSGMKQKLGLIQALMHRPDLLILDEPTNALDPLIRLILFAELRNVVAENRTVLLSSHNLSEVEELCDDVIIIRSGNIVENQSIDELRRRAIRKVELIYSKGSTIPREISEHVQILEQDDGKLTCTWSSSVDSLLEWLQSQALDDVVIGKPNLEDLFLTYYREQ